MKQMDQTSDLGNAGQVGESSGWAFSCTGAAHARTHAHTHTHTLAPPLSSSLSLPPLQSADVQLQLEFNGTKTRPLWDSEDEEAFSEGLQSRKRRDFEVLRREYLPHKSVHEVRGAR